MYETLLFWVGKGIFSAVSCQGDDVPTSDHGLQHMAPLSRLSHRSRRQAHMMAMGGLGAAAHGDGEPARRCATPAGMPHGDGGRGGSGGGNGGGGRGGRWLQRQTNP